MFASFVSALLKFRVREFRMKSKTQKPEEIIVECTLYMRIAVNMIPSEVMEEYQEDIFLEDGWNSFETNKGMYGLT